MKAVQLALDIFLNRLAGESIVLMNDKCHNGGVSSEAGGTSSWIMCNMAWKVVQWLELHSVAILAHYIPGKKIILTSLSMEWSLLPQVFDAV